MKLHSLKPAEGSVKNNKDSEEDRAQEEEELPPEATMDKNPARATLENLVSRVGKCLCSAGFQNSVSGALTGSN